MTAFINNRDFDSKAKAASKYATAMKTDMSTGGSFQSAAARTLGFAQKVASGGLDNALREYNREDLIGKPSEVVWTELLHEFTNSGASVEDNMAADALSQAMDKRSYNKRQVGTEKENLAAEYLKKKGYFIIEKNYRVRQGEIDLIARDSMCIVFIEVKYRANGRSGDALEAVTRAKIRQISKTALFYLNQKKISIENTPIRFDVIGINGDSITHVENAFDFVMTR